MSQAHTLLSDLSDPYTPSQNGGSQNRPADKQGKGFRQETKVRVADARGMPSRRNRFGRIVINICAVIIVGCAFTNLVVPAAAAAGGLVIGCVMVKNQRSPPR